MRGERGGEGKWQGVRGNDREQGRMTGSEGE